jgi:hypothetical protein
MQNNSSDRFESVQDAGRLKRTVLFTTTSRRRAVLKQIPLLPYLNAALKYFVASGYKKRGARVFIIDVDVFSYRTVLGNVLKTEV